jgi:hypothetical protein
VHFFSVRLKFGLVSHCPPSFGLTDDSKTRSLAAYPGLSSAPLDDSSYDMTVILNQRLPTPMTPVSSPTEVLPPDLGSVYGALFSAARSALWGPRSQRPEVSSTSQDPM